MTKKIYKTAQGRTIDLGALVLQNENTRAVGNMGVNARGDRVNSRNQPIDSRNRQVARQYNKQVSSNVNDQPVFASRRAAQEKAKADEVVKSAKAKTQHRDDPAVPEVVEPVLPAENAPSQPESGGLAAAIAKARSIKQEPLKTPRQLSRETPGVRKI